MRCCQDTESNTRLSSLLSFSQNTSSQLSELLSPLFFFLPPLSTVHTRRNIKSFTGHLLRLTCSFFPSSPIHPSLSADQVKKWNQASYGNSPHVEWDRHYSVQDDDVGQKDEQGDNRGTAGFLFRDEVLPGEEILKVVARHPFPHAARNGANQAHSDQEHKNLKHQPLPNYQTLPGIPKEGHQLWLFLCLVFVLGGIVALSPPTLASEALLCRFWVTVIT